MTRCGRCTAPAPTMPTTPRSCRIGIMRGSRRWWRTPPPRARGSCRRQNPTIPPGRSKRKFPPTLVVGATPEMTIMQEEIFGPLLPIVGYRNAAEPIAWINRHDRPLALYWFGKDDAARDEVLARTVSGGVTVNDCLFHFTQINQPMGGVGASGTGAYHGEWGFRDAQQAEAGVLSLAVQPARRSLSALWRQDRAAAEDAAVFVVEKTATPSLRARKRTSPSPLAGRGRGGGSATSTVLVATPTPDPPPQGGREKNKLSGGQLVTDTFDFVVVGGGSGGCAVAGRLSEDPQTSVALLDAGGKNDNWVVTTPFALVLMVAGNVNNWAFNTVPQTGPQRPHRLPAARQGARRIVRDQRHGLYPRPPQRLRPMGRARQRRLVVRRRAALLQALGEQRRFRRRISRQGRPAAGQQTAHRQSGAGDFPAGRAEAQFPHSRRFQRRRAGRPRRLSGDAEERRALERGARLYPSAHGQPRQSARRDQGALPRASCSRASARSASNTARARS